MALFGFLYGTPRGLVSSIGKIAEFPAKSANPLHEGHKKGFCAFLDALFKC
jgi:hypothetical protein